MKALHLLDIARCDTGDEPSTWHALRDTDDNPGTWHALRDTDDKLSTWHALRNGSGKPSTGSALRDTADKLSSGHALRDNSEMLSTGLSMILAYVERAPMSQRIYAYVRIRPLSSSEKRAGEKSCWQVSGNTISAAEGYGKQSVSSSQVDHVFDTDSDNKVVYDIAAQDLVGDVVNGVNGTLIAYGQTSGGKTHTMIGTREEPGVISRAVEDIFHRINASDGREFLVRVSYLELYNEEVRDLLAPGKPLRIFDRGHVSHVEGLHEEPVGSLEALAFHMNKGDYNRHVGTTDMNSQSSRSHAIFRIVIESRSRAQGQPVSAAHHTDEQGEARGVLVSTLCLVDLAGSERLSKTGADGAQIKEGVNINKSLSVLGNVISILSSAKTTAETHIPYRDSKLTRILQPGLGGNAKTAIICAMTPSARHLDESKGTLGFACRAMRVTNHVTVNRIRHRDSFIGLNGQKLDELRVKLQEAGQSSETLDTKPETKKTGSLAALKWKLKASSQAEQESHKKAQQHLQDEFDSLMKLMLVGKTQTHTGNPSDERLKHSGRVLHAKPRSGDAGTDTAAYHCSAAFGADTNDHDGRRCDVPSPVRSNFTMELMHAKFDKGTRGAGPQQSIATRRGPALSLTRWDSGGADITNWLVSTSESVSPAKERQLHRSHHDGEVGHQPPSPVQIQSEQSEASTGFFTPRASLVPSTEQEALTSPHQAQSEERRENDKRHVDSNNEQGALGCLQVENARLEQENESLRGENEGLKLEMASLKAENKRLFESAHSGVLTKTLRLRSEGGIGQASHFVSVLKEDTLEKKEGKFHVTWNQRHVELKADGSIQWGLQGALPIDGGIAVRAGLLPEAGEFWVKIVQSKDAVKGRVSQEGKERLGRTKESGMQNLQFRALSIKASWKWVELINSLPPNRLM
ncbi:hypothetical protein CYMTET_20434 [Cymbomonas tetramitiformis]|uniref:Kinesin-like protein n=1 Tax=Cymbomonas tetramitiformis TaxID=36881 RepID=A0AAE0G5G2_9CHLO|nr:hypothetical protein CYMTET_20434 [Cymbomonas tetramitiformis]